MNRFFVRNEQIGEDTITITGSDVNHITHVLRLGTGDRVMVVGEDGIRRICEIRECLLETVVVSCVEVLEYQAELPVPVTLYQGLPKGDKLEWIVQKATELGVTRVVPVAMERSVVRWEEKKSENKRKRLALIAESAAKQSGRNRIPEVALPLSVKEAIREAKERGDLCLMPYELSHGMEETRRILSGLSADRGISILIGPEGGIGTKEACLAVEEGFLPVSLGPRILRTETAGLYVLSVLGYILDC